MRIAALLEQFVALFQQKLHIVFRMAGAVANKSDVRVNKLQLQHLFMVARTVGIKTVQIDDHDYPQRGVRSGQRRLSARRFVRQPAILQVTELTLILPPALAGLQTLTVKTSLMV